MLVIQKVPFKTTCWGIAKTIDELRRKLSQKENAATTTATAANLLLDSIYDILV